MSARRLTTEDLPEALREITTLDRAACTARWKQMFGLLPPRYTSIQFMQRVLAREAQICVLGGTTPIVLRALKTAMLEARSDAQEPSLTAQSGDFLVREWHGRTYRVEVTAAGYILNGQTFGSLSAVARKITGANWSGPRFFGLTAKRVA